MKYIITLMVVVILGVGIYIFPQTEEYRATITEVVTQEVVTEVDALEKRVTEAQSASSTEIEQAAQKAYDDEKKRMLTEIELMVTREYRKEVEAKEAELESSVSLVSARVN